MTYYSLVIGISYLIGSLPVGWIVGKIFYNKDIRYLGSHNIGATNVYRVFGLRPALLVFLLDAAKGVAGVYLGQFWLATPAGILLGGISALIGHNWSILLKFKGGRGVATGLGIIIVLVPKVALAVFIVWICIVYLTRYVSLGSIVAAFLVPVLMWVFNAPYQYLIFGIIAVIFVIYRHRANIERLLSGQELKISLGQTKPENKED